MVKPPKLAIRKVCKSFLSAQGEVEALHDLTLEVGKGEIACLVGPSGCGKSTLLNLVAGLEQPTSGEIFIDGKVPGGPGPDRLIVFQEGALFPWLRAVDNVAFGLKLAGYEAKERRSIAREYLGRLGLARFADSFIHELSVGMRQRVALARALVMEPQIMLMDEPFAALDAQTRDSLHAEMQRLWADTGTTVLFVTHNVREAACLGDRIFVMSGRPGTITAERRCDAPRPRAIEDAPVIALARTLRDDLTKAHAMGGDAAESKGPGTRGAAAESRAPAGPESSGGPGGDDKESGRKPAGKKARAREGSP
jgi:NitT/TauT family transport system ATP-binding protein